MMKRKGYLWNYHGFTKLHLWGVLILGGGLAGVGAGLLTVASLDAIDHGMSSRVAHLLAFAGIAFLGTITVYLASMLSLLFFLGADRLGLLESEDHTQASTHNK
jgi:hypothetical protein